MDITTTEVESYNVQIVESYNVQIWAGLRDINGMSSYEIDDVYNIVQKHVDVLGECVSITPTKFIYTNGSEDGVVVGFINYPRFPKEKEEILDRAWKLAEKLLISLSQCRVTITTPNKTFMLTNENKIPK